MKSLLLLALFCLTGLQAWSETPVATPAAPPASSDGPGLVSDDLRAQKFMVKIGTIDYQYEEPGLMKIHGRLNNIETSFHNKIGHAMIPMFYNVNLDYAFGDQTYDGGVTSGGVTTPKSAPSKDKIIALEGHFGAAFFDSSLQDLEAYSGLGIWALTNKIDGTGSYTRDITYIYLPTGLRYSIRAGESVKFTAGAQYNIFLAGSVKSHLSEASSSLSDVDNSQSSGKGYRLNTTGELNMQRWSAFLEVYYQNWDIEDSSTTASGLALWIEPHNTTKMTGVNFGARF